MKSWLKRIGEVAAKGAVAVSGIDRFLPVLRAIAPQAAQDELQAVENTLPKIAHAIEQVEMVGAALGLPGDQKLKAAIPLVGQALLHSPLLKGKKVQDEALFLRACQKYADATADLLNSFSAEHVTVSEENS